MSEEQPEKWAVGLTDEFTYQINVRSTQAELERQQKRAEQAEASLEKYREALSDARRLRIGKLAGQVRKRGNKAGEQSSKSVQGSQPSSPGKSPTPSEIVDARTEALNSRLRVVLSEYGIDVAHDQRLSESIADLAALLDAQPKDKPLAWLTYVAVMSRYPKHEDILRFATEVQVSRAPMALAQLLRLNSELAPSWTLAAELELVRDVVVDASLTAKRTFHTGIQRVVRETVPRWAKKHPVELVVWGTAGTFRPPSRAEEWRVLEFEPRQTNVPGGDEKVVPTKIRVPWKTIVIAPEPTSPIDRSEALACLAEWSGSDLTTVFYDFVMYLFPEAFKDQSRLGLSDFITAMRASKRVSAISNTIGDDVRHYAETIGNAGMPIPEVRAQVLPVEAVKIPSAELAANTPRIAGVPGLPVVLSVGSIEPRKNHLMTLRAAERLWQEGVQFQLVLIGWGSWRADAVMAEFERLQSKGRPVRMIRRADEALLWSAFEVAAFTVYISLAEGYGLPAAESIAVGTPVVLSDIGSMAEIGAGGGAVLVNPRDLDEVADAMRTLLTNPDELAALAEQARSHPQSTWDDYAEQTWKWLVDGEG